MGSKSRIAKHIVPIIQRYIDENNIEKYVEPFVGGANVIDKVQCKEKYGFDKNKYLIALLKRVQSGEKLYDVSPTEFVGLIKNATFVLTDSFHCSVFSMMYHVPFMTLLRFQKNDSLSTNTRIYSMLQQFGLGNRILDNEVKIDDLLQTTIDFSYIEEILSKKREQSNKYLDIALHDEKAKV